MLFPEITPLIFSIFLGIFGLFWGSFANVVIYRLRHGGSITFDRSRCRDCKHTLSGLDLVPLFSWLFLRGKCRYCKKSISSQYPIVEAVFGLSWFGLAMLQGMPNTASDWMYFGFLIFLISALIITSVYDLLYLEIPDEVSFPLILLSGLALALPQSPSLESAAWAVFIIFTFFYLQILIPAGMYAKEKKDFSILKEAFLGYFIFPLWILFSIIIPQKFVSKIPLFNESDNPEEIPSWIGGGDLRLAFVMGLALGVQSTIIALFVAYISGALVGILGIIFGKQTRKSQLPFGPFLALGTIVALFWGEILWEAYWGFLIV